jgi:hypothetical protein
VIFRDFNVRDEEVQVMCSTGSCSDAEYVDCSWDMCENSYREEYEGLLRKAPARSFDRLLYSGCVLAQSCLVGRRRVSWEYCEFCLSDHYAIFGLVDFRAFSSSDFAGKSCADRRLALSRVRDQVCAGEQFVVQEMSRISRQGSVAQRAEADVKKAADVAKEYEAGARARRERQQDLWMAAFGSESLFAIRRDLVFAGLGFIPSAPAEVGIRSYIALSIAGARAVWRRHVFPRLGGFRNVGNTCYLNCVAQVMVRTPAVRVWLARREQVCGVARDQCVACALSRSCHQLALAGACPTLAVVRELVGSRFVGHAQCDASEFAECLVDALRAEEIARFRFGPWPGVVVGDGVRVATRVDRLFAFVEERRAECGAFRAASRRYSTQCLARSVGAGDCRRHRSENVGAWRRSVFVAWVQNHGTAWGCVSRRGQREQRSLHLLRSWF